MDIKKKLLKQMVDIDGQIIYVVWHHRIIYVPLMIISAIGIIILFFLYKFLLVFSHDFATYTAGIGGVFLYIYFVLNFLDIYLDAIIVTDSSIIVYKWYWLLKATTDVLDFDAVESVYADQSGLLDILFDKGDLYLRRAGHENVFEDVPKPNKVASQINELIRKYSSKAEEDFTDNSSDEEDAKEKRIRMLAEILTEVIDEIK